MTLPDFPDWATPVSGVESTTDLTGGSVPITANGAGVTVNTAGVTSMDVAIELPASAAGHRFALALQWIESEGLADLDVITFHSAASYLSSPNTLLTHRPVRGEQLTAQLVGDVSPTVNFSVIGSSRPIDTDSLQVTPTGWGRRLAIFTGTPIAPSGTATLYIPPAAGQIALAWAPGVSTKLTAQLNAVSFDGAAMSADIMAIWTAALAGLYTDPIPAPGIGAELLISNTDTSNRSPTITVWDVS